MPEPTDDQVRELVENAYQVQQMTEHPGWAVLLDFVVNTGGLRAWQNFVLGGAAKNPEEYKEHVGRIKGCEHVIYAPLRIQAMADAARGATEKSE